MTFVNRFVYSDPHFGHENILTFKDSKGAPLRPFKSLEEMHGEMIKRWNSIVKPTDKVYVLGDVIMNLRKGEHVLGLLNGKKSLIKGNHDIFNKSGVYEKYFQNIHGVKVFPYKYVFTHVPIHPDCLNGSSWPVNVHGHLHSNEIKDTRYISACVEKINYTPLAFEELDLIIKKRGITSERKK